jgi:hypothetical protein
MNKTSLFYGLKSFMDWFEREEKRTFRRRRRRRDRSFSFVTENLYNKEALFAFDL